MVPANDFISVPSAHFVGVDRPDFWIAAGVWKILAGRDLASTLFGQILRPLPGEWRRLLRLHAEAMRIAETRLSHIGHPEVARALEQDLIYALVSCLTTAEPRGYSAATCRRFKLLLRLEEVLMACPRRPPHVSQVCEVIGVSERTLRDLLFAVPRHGTRPVFAFAPA